MSTRVGKWALVFQGQSFDEQYKKTLNMKHVEGLETLHDCCSEPIDLDSDDLYPVRHNKWDSEFCADIECMYADGCSFTDGNQEVRAGAGVYWPQAELCKFSQGYQLGKQTSQYAELAAVLIALMQVIDFNLKEIVVCTDSEYVTKSFLEYLPRWRQS